MNERETQLELVRRYLDGTATAEEVRSLESLILKDPGLRREFLHYANVDAALAGTRRPQVPVIAQPKRKIGPSWRPLAAAAAGVVIGIFCTSMVFAYASPKFAMAKARVLRLWSEGFESGPMETLPGLPREAGTLSGDEARVVTTENGLKPKSGTKMLRFVSATFAGENAKKSAWGDVYRLVDLREQMSGGKATVRLTANFNGVHFPQGEEYSCDLELCALEDDPAEAPQPLALPWVRENSASVAGRKFPMKGDGVWQEAVVEVPVSPQTRFVLAHLAVLRRKPFPPVEPVRFGAHYVDDVKLELLTQPDTP